MRLIKKNQMKHTPPSTDEEGEKDRIGLVKERTKSLDSKVPCVPDVTQAAEVGRLIKYTASLGA